MRRLLYVAGLSFFTCGCSTDYAASYQTDCGGDQALAVQRLRVIAQEVSSRIGSPALISEHPFRMKTQISNPPPGGGEIWFEYNQDVAVTMILPGKGSEDYAIKIKSVVEDSLSRNCKSAWKFQDQVQSFHLSK